MWLPLIVACAAPEAVIAPEDADDDGVLFPEDCDDGNPLVQACPVGPWVDVTAGRYHSCATRADGTATCWGAPGPGNDVGQTRPPQGRFREVETWESFSCGVGEDFGASCWGTLPSGTRPTVPRRPVTGISVGWDHACGIGEEGKIVCWGDCYSGQCTASGEGWGQVEAGFVSTCAVPVGGGALGCWGEYTATQFPPSGDFATVNVGLAFACALDLEGAIVCWGADDNGADPEGAIRGAPSRTGFRAISVGDGTVCAIDADDTLVCWGENWGGQAEPPPGRFVRVSVGFEHGCALTDDGEISCWGYAEYGQLDVP